MKLRIATPCFGGMCGSNYLRSLLETMAMLSKEGVRATVTILDNESLIPRARNKLVRNFMQGDDTHLLFWDADMGVDVADLREMLAYGEMEEYQVIGPVYPKKTVDWEAVRQALAADPAISAAALAAVAGKYVVNAIDGNGKVGGKVELPTQVQEVGTGLMLVQRGVFVKMAVAYPQLWYEPLDGDHGGEVTEESLHEPMFSYFESGVQQAYGKTLYLSEDFAFCQRCKQIDVKVWIAPWVRTVHRGMFDFQGDLIAAGRAQGRAKRVKSKAPVSVEEDAGVTKPFND